MKLKGQLIAAIFFGAGLFITACSSGASEDQQKTVYIAPVTVECEGAGPQNCLLIRENQEDPWSLYYHQIEGFEYQEGLLYELRVEEQAVEDPPADGSSTKLVLDEVIATTPVAIKSVYIGPEQIGCEGEGTQLCYQYRENQTDLWLLYHGEIHGLDYEEGYTYELLVAETNVEDPPAGSMSTELTLLQIVEKVEVQESVIGTVWALASLYGQPVMDGSSITMEITEERIGGFAGCNTYFGPFSVDGDQLDIGPLAATKKACLEPDLMAQEFTFLDALESATAFEFTSSTKLELSDDRGDGTMTFEKIQPAPLEITLWELSTYNNGSNALAGVQEGSRITAIFDEGTVGGSAGCNNYSGPYETDGTDISIGLMAITMKMCPEPGIMEQEQLYLGALQSAASYKITAKQLVLTNADGATAAIFLEAEPVSLESAPWEVISYNNGRGGVVSVIIGSRITANFDGEQVNGSGGCNNYFGSYETEGDNISIGPLANTEMACMDPEGVMAQEQEYLAALQTAAIYRIDGDRVDFRTADGALAAAMVAAQPVSLVDRQWQVTAYNNGRGGFTSVIIDTELSMLFEGGTLSGSAGCNNYNAAYEIDGEKIDIGPGATTRKFCSDPEGIMDQEQEFLSALESAAVYKIDGDELEMRTAEGSLAIGATLLK